MIENPEHLEAGKPQITVDGTAIAGNVLPDFADGRMHEVRVVMVSERGEEK